MSRIRKTLSASCLKNTLVLLLFSFVVPSGSVFAQNPPAPAIDENLQKFLNVPIWYLNFRIEVQASGQGGSADWSWRSSIERVYSGTQVLGMRSQGPSLTMPELAVEASTVPGKLEEIMAHFANWLPGNTIDESKTDAENDAEFNRLWEANQKAMARLHYSYWDSGTDGPNWEQAGGSGVATIGGNIQLEFDAEKKKYNFLFMPGVFDNPSTVTAVRGAGVLNEGSKSENRYTVERGIDSAHAEIISMVPPLGGGPMGANIVGDLPASFGPISGVSHHIIKARFHGDVSGTYVITYTLSPNPPTPVELLIIPPNDYYNWRPMGGKDEEESGDWIPVKVKLQKAGGGDPQFKAVEFKYRLKDTSHEKGVCMNFPLNADPDSLFDLQIEEDQNPDLIVLDDDRQKADQLGTDMTEGEVIISSFDYGAYGDLEVEAKLSNGEIVKGVLVGTGEEKLKLPHRKDGSYIADIFVRNLGSYTDKDDNEDDPVGDGYKGDGISLYEEYRGFKNGKKWVTGDPKKKDVFVYNEIHGALPIMRGIGIFQKATGLVVHKDLLKSQVRADMVINFNFNPETHLSEDQHVIRLKSSKKLSEGADRAFVEEVGTPGTAKSVNIPPDWDDFRMVQDIQVPDKDRTTAHEMGHDVNIWHHGEIDRKERWFLDGNKLMAQVAYVDNTGQYRFGNTRIEITVKLEDGTVLSPEEVLGQGITQRLAWIGKKHGQHSGVEDCLMRYWIATAYLTDPESNVRYLSPGEISGAKFCTTANGTGINDLSHFPESRYGSAASPYNGPNAGVTDNRGNCMKQIRVNDIGEEPHR